MIYPSPLLPGKLIQRYKRFLADVELADGEAVTAHCANPGSMLGLARPGMPVWLSRATDSKRKLQYSWELVEADLGAGPALVGINTSRPNGLVEEAIRAEVISELSGYAGLRREVRYGANSRIDLLLERDDQPPCYVEVKNVHLMRERGLAEFPDSVTKRGAKHLTELARLAQERVRAVTIYLVQRQDAHAFSLARDIDPVYGEAFDRAKAAGVEMLCYACTLTHEGINAERALPLRA